jgi:Zn-dependent peptidase ImmA (M78 family)
MIAPILLCFYAGCFPLGSVLAESTIYGVPLYFVRDDAMNIAAGSYDTVKDVIAIRASMSEYSEEVWRRVLYHEYGHHVCNTIQRDKSEACAEAYSTAHWMDEIKS